MISLLSHQVCASDLLCPLGKSATLGIEKKTLATLNSLMSWAVAFIIEICIKFQLIFMM
jgi:hypothetical protein